MSFGCIAQLKRLPRWQKVGKLPGFVLQPCSDMSTYVSEQIETHVRFLPRPHTLSMIAEFK